MGIKIIRCVLFLLYQTRDFWNLRTLPLLVSTHFQFPFFLSPGNLQDGVSLSQVQIGGRLVYFYKILQDFTVFFNFFQCFFNMFKYFSAYIYQKVSNIFHYFSIYFSIFFYIFQFFCSFFLIFFQYFFFRKYGVSLSSTNWREDRLLLSRFFSILQYFTVFLIIFQYFSVLSVFFNIVQYLQYFFSSNLFIYKVLWIFEVLKIRKNYSIIVLVIFSGHKYSMDSNAENSNRY